MNEIIETPRLILKALDYTYASKLLEFVSNGRQDFERYETTKAPEFYTVKYQKLILDTEYKLMMQQKYARYYIFEKDNANKIIGTVSFGFFRPIPFSSCSLGYKLLRQYRGNGYMHEACSHAIPHIFEELGLHQIFAYIMPENVDSIRLIHKLGFQNEGLSKQGLCVQGVWQDHFVFKLINPACP